MNKRRTIKVSDEVWGKLRAVSFEMGKTIGDVISDLVLGVVPAISCSAGKDSGQLDRIEGKVDELLSREMSCSAGDDTFEDI